MIETITQRNAILIALSLIGISAITAFHPHIRLSSSPTWEWLYMASLPLGAAALCWGLYALMFRQRARSGWPVGFLALAWLFAVSNVVGPYLDSKKAPGPPVVASPAPAVQRVYTDEEVGIKPATTPATPRVYTDEEVGIVPVRSGG